MSTKLRHISLLLCYVLAWLLPLVHEHDVEVERAEHCLCIAEYSLDCNAGATILHAKCHHHHHDDEHCAICQSGQTIRHGIVLSRKPMLQLQEVNPPAPLEKQQILSHQRLWHALQPRAP